MQRLHTECKNSRVQIRIHQLLRLDWYCRYCVRSRRYVSTHLLFVPSILLCLRGVGGSPSVGGFLAPCDGAHFLPFAPCSSSRVFGACFAALNVNRRKCTFHPIFIIPCARAALRLWTTARVFCFVAKVHVHPDLRPVCTHHASPRPCALIPLCARARTSRFVSMSAIYGYHI